MPYKLLSVNSGGTLIDADTISNKAYRRKGDGLLNPQTHVSRFQKSRYPANIFGDFPDFIESPPGVSVS